MCVCVCVCVPHLCGRRIPPSRIARISLSSLSAQSLLSILLYVYMSYIAFKLCLFPPLSLSPYPVPTTTALLPEFVAHSCEMLEEAQAKFVRACVLVVYVRRTLFISRGGLSKRVLLLAFFRDLYISSDRRRRRNMGRREAHTHKLVRPSHARYLCSKLYWCCYDRSWRQLAPLSAAFVDMMALRKCLDGCLILESQYAVGALRAKEAIYGPRHVAGPMHRSF